MTVSSKRVDINHKLSNFGQSGYVLHSLENKQSILDLRTSFDNELKKLISQEATLETYHQFVGGDDEKHIKFQYELSQIFWEGQWHLEIFKKNRPFFEELAGPDLDVQVKPHFRLARPDKPQDNIGFHRDIEYGSTAYEISCFFALTDIVPEGALQLVPRSHTLSNVKLTSVNNDEVEKGSIKHELGVPYLFQVITDDSFRSKLIPVPMKVGDVLCFNLAVIHGQEINKSQNTRWTIDARIKNSFITSGTRDGYYKNLFQSPAAHAGLNHYQKNPKP
ncbi:MAG: phytanoyl-CoA dioxygenase family protein [Nitrospinaceae bacterium]